MILIYVMKDVICCFVYTFLLFPIISLVTELKRNHPDAFPLHVSSTTRVYPSYTQELPRKTRWYWKCRLSKMEYRLPNPQYALQTLLTDLYNQIRILLT